VLSAPVTTTPPPPERTWRVQTPRLQCQWRLSSEISRIHLLPKITDALLQLSCPGIYVSLGPYATLSFYLAFQSRFCTSDILSILPSALPFRQLSDDPVRNDFSSWHCWEALFQVKLIASLQLTWFAVMWVVYGANHWMGPKFTLLEARGVPTPCLLLNLARPGPAVAGLVFPYMPLYVLRCLYLSWHHQVGVWKTWYKYKQGQIKEYHHFVLDLATLKGKYGPIRTKQGYALPCLVGTFFDLFWLEIDDYTEEGTKWVFILICPWFPIQQLYALVIFCFIGAKWSRLDLISPY
jgi:hypothetical protein